MCHSYLTSSASDGRKAEDARTRKERAGLIKRLLDDATRRAGERHEDTEGVKETAPAK